MEKTKILARILPFCFAIHLHNKLLQIGMKIVPIITEIVTIFLTSPTLSVNQKE
jgi:hypothetical protein